MNVLDIRTAFLLAAMTMSLLTWWRLPSPRERAFRLAGTIAVLALPLEVYGYVTTLHEYNNSLAYNVFVLIEFVLMLRVLENDWRERVGLGAIGAVAITLFLCNALFADPRSEMMIEGIVVLSTVLALLLALVLWRFANHSPVALHNVPKFWLHIGALLYFGGIPPVVTMARYVYAQDTALVTKLWTIVPVLCALRYLCVAFAMHLERKLGSPSTE